MSSKQLLLLCWLACRQAHACESQPSHTKEPQDAMNKLVSMGLFDPGQNSTDNMLDDMVNKLTDKLVDKLVGHISVAPRINVGHAVQRPHSRQTYANFASPFTGSSPHVFKKTMVDRPQVRANAFSFFKKKEPQAPKPPIEISQDFKLAGGTLVTTAALAAIGAPVVFPAFFGLLGALLSVQSTRVIFCFDDKAFEVRVKGSGGETKDSGENFAVGGENRWNYNTFTRWSFIPSEEFPLFMYFYETQTNGAKDEQFHLFPVIMNSQELLDTMKEKVGADKVKPLSFGEFIEGAKSADRVG